MRFEEVQSLVIARLLQLLGVALQEVLIACDKYMGCLCLKVFGLKLWVVFTHILNCSGNLTSPGDFSISCDCGLDSQVVLGADILLEILLKPCVLLMNLGSLFIEISFL